MLIKGDEVVDYNIIIICEHEIAVGRMKELLQKSGIYLLNRSSTCY